MFKIVRFSLFILLLVPFSVFAQDWVGFKKVEGSTDIPHSNDVLSSVFQIYTYNAVSEDKFEVVTTSAEKQITQTDILDTDHRALQIETCRRYAMEKCPISTRRSSSTVVISGGTKLQGCRHSFHNWLAMGSKLNNIPIQSMHVPMVIMNYKNDVVYNSAYSPADFKITFINTSDRLNTVYDSETLAKEKPKFAAYRVLTDSISISFSASIAETTSFNYFPPANGTTVYIFGYPAKTNYFGGLKNGDAPGNTLVSAYGPITELSNKKKRISIESPIGSGMSGGPILDTNGSLIGIACQGAKDNTEGQLNDEKQLNSLWSTLEGLSLD